MMRDILYPLRRLHGSLHNRLYEYKRKRTIRQFRNKHLGKRCFIVGNGPSLTVEDLEKLKNEYCFGSHKVYHIFDRTQWRPTYYCAQDQKLIKQAREEICGLKIPTKFIACYHPDLDIGIDGAVPTQLLIKDFYPELPQFSDDLELGTYEGFTVTYMCIQIAVYMGFREIYLLGVDHAYSLDMNPDGSVKKNEGVKDHFSDRDEITNVPQTYKSTLAYIAAQEYAKNHGIRIYNATRGGALDAFERVDLDTICLE